jgi:high-affinity nickel permease
VILEAPLRALESVDHWLTGLMSGAPLVVALGVACLLGLRHASDPDHLVAVTALAADDRNPSDAVRLGAWWGLGHAGTLLVVGLPLVFLESELPAWLEGAAEKAVGIVILLLAVRLLVRWQRGRSRGADAPGRTQVPVRTSREALAIGVLHGVAGSGAVVVLLITQLPSTTAAALALAAFAPMSMLSMMMCTSGFAWAFTRPAVLPLYHSVVIPALGAFSLMFGGWYSGIL